MLSNAYFLAKFHFDTAENEPAQNLQNFAKIAKNCKKLLILLTLTQARADRDVPADPPAAERALRGRLRGPREEQRQGLGREGPAQERTPQGRLPDRVFE